MTSRRIRTGSKSNKSSFQKTPVHGEAHFWKVPGASSDTAERSAVRGASLGFMPQEPKSTPRHQPNATSLFFDLSQTVEFSSKI